MEFFCYHLKIDGNLARESEIDGVIDAYVIDMDIRREIRRS